jgi:hypothetical protein
MEKILIRNAIRTPDGTVLISRYRHDYSSHTDANGDYYSNDGGLDYQHRTVNKIPAEDLSLYNDAPHEQIREVLERGGRGADGKQPLKYIKLSEIGDEYLQAIIEYEEELRPMNKYLPIYKQEQKFRKNEL